MPISKSALRLSPLLIIVCASPALIQCAKPAQLGSDSMHAMGMKGVVQRNIESCKSEAAAAFRKNFSQSPDLVDTEYVGSQAAKLLKALSPAELSEPELILGAYQVAVKEGFCRLNCDELGMELALYAGGFPQYTLDHLNRRMMGQI